MSSEREQRLEQLRSRRENGEAFAYSFDRSHTIRELRELDEEDRNLPDRAGIYPGCPSLSDDG